MIADLQLLKVDPEIICVEELVRRDIFEGLLVFIWGHSALSKNQTPVLLPLGQVSSLLV